MRNDVLGMIEPKLMEYQRTKSNGRSTLDKVLFPVHITMLAAFVTLVVFLGLNCHHLSHGFS